MNKLHHPHDRAERMKLKELHTAHKAPASLKKIKQLELKEREADNELLRGILDKD